MDPNSLNNTQNVSNTQNPQGTGNPGANNAEDFQSTASSDALNQEADNLSVERTGEPVTGAPAPEADNAISSWWIGIVILSVVFIIWAVYRLLKEEVEIFTPESSPKSAASTTKAAASSKTRPARKTTRSGKKKTTAKKKSKKSSKKR